MKWLDASQNAEKEEIESMKKELEDVAKPITKIIWCRSEASGMPGGMPSGMPGGMPDMSQMPDMSRLI